MNINIKRLSPSAKLPTLGSTGAAAVDLYADLGYGVEVQIFEGENAVIVPTGVAMQIPPGFCGLLLPRSGLASTSGIRPANTPGLIDSDYRGEIKVALIKDSQGIGTVKHGDRIAQLLIVASHQAEFVLVDELDSTSRGAGGFGSTGK